MFLEHFARMANITKACEVAGISRRVVYDWQEKDEAFSFSFNEANAIATEVLEAEAWRRAHDGTDKPVFHQGRKIGTVREHSDTLLIFLLKARAPEKYRERVDVTLTIRDEAQRIADQYGIPIEQVYRDAGIRV